MASKPAPLQILQSHRHDDIGCGLRSRILNLHARHGIGQQDTHILALQRVKHIQYIADVKADFHLSPGIGDVQNLFRFFLFRVIGGDFQLIFTDVKAHAAEFFVRKNRRAGKGLLENIAAGVQVLIRIFR